MTFPSFRTKKRNEPRTLFFQLAERAIDQVHQASFSGSPWYSRRPFARTRNPSERHFQDRVTEHWWAHGHLRVMSALRSSWSHLTQLCQPNLWWCSVHGSTWGLQATSTFRSQNWRLDSSGWEQELCYISHLKSSCCVINTAVKSLIDRVHWIRLHEACRSRELTTRIRSTSQAAFKWMLSHVFVKTGSSYLVYRIRYWL